MSLKSMFLALKKVVQVFQIGGGGGGGTLDKIKITAAFFRDVLPQKESELNLNNANYVDLYFQLYVVGFESIFVILFNSRNKICC